MVWIDKQKWKRWNVWDWRSYKCNEGMTLKELWMQWRHEIERVINAIREWNWKDYKCNEGSERTKNK